MKKNNLLNQLLEYLVLIGVIVFLAFIFLIEILDLFFLRPIARLFKKKKRRRR